jgi:hypothetical protein
LLDTQEGILHYQYQVIRKKETQSWDAVNVTEMKSFAVDYAEVVITACGETALSNVKTLSAEQSARSRNAIIQSLQKISARFIIRVRSILLWRHGDFYGRATPASIQQAGIVFIYFWPM